LSYIAETKRIYSTEGLKGFTRGYKGMLLRDGPGFSIYFGLYGYLKQKFGVTDKDKINNYNGMSDG